MKLQNKIRLNTKDFKLNSNSFDKNKSMKTAVPSHQHTLVFSTSVQSLL